MEILPFKNSVNMFHNKTDTNYVEYQLHAIRKTTNWEGEKSDRMLRRDNRWHYEFAIFYTNLN